MKEIIVGREVAGFCGPACLAHVAKEQGVGALSQSALASEIYDPNWGTDGEAMLRGLTLLGLSGEWRQQSLNELNEERKKGHSVIVNYMSGPNDAEDGHYSVLYAVTETTVAINNPEWVGMITIFRREDFERIWYDIAEDGARQERWALVITRPDEGDTGTTGEVFERAPYYGSA